MPDVRWREVEPLTSMNGDVSELLAAIGDIREIWQRSIDQLSDAEFHEIRARTLRRHAVETGIIERLYDLEWGITETLVAEGLTDEIAAREGGITTDTLDVIRAQYGGLEMIADVARGDRPLSVQFIRELHQMITMHQAAYDGRDQFDRPSRLPLHHGEWKKWANHVRRPDGSVLEYVPPEQVQPQMELLIAEFEAAASAHPIHQAAWLHHRFICIHPFEDGNGRVARALVLLVLQRHHYAPIVVDRRQRSDYIASLDAANDGDLRPLVKFFARLERIALRREMRPVEVNRSAAPVQVARDYVERLLSKNIGLSTDQLAAAVELADQIKVRLRTYLDHAGEELQAEFSRIDPESKAVLFDAGPPDERARYWTTQLRASAEAVDFIPNLREGSWWVRLHLTVLGVTLRYVAAIQKVGQADTGVLAVTAFAERLDPVEKPEDLRPSTKLLELGPDDSVTLLFSDDPGDRWGEVRDLTERLLSASVAEFSEGLS